MTAEEFNSLMEATASMKWRCNLPELFCRLMDTEHNAICKVPVNITIMLLTKVAERVIEIEDPALISLMCRLSLITAEGGSIGHEWTEDFLHGVQKPNK